MLGAQLRGAYLLEKSAQLAAILQQIALLEDIRRGYIESNARQELIAVANSQIARLKLQAGFLQAEVDREATR